MSTPPKVDSIIRALQTIDSTMFEHLCADLIYHGALIPDLKHKLIYPTGQNISKNFTIRGSVDAVIDLKEGLCVCEFSRAEDWIQKLKHDIKSIRKWMQESEPRRLARVIFITTRDIGNKTILSGDEERLPPEKFIEKEFSQFNIQAHVFGQKHLLRVLRNKEYSEIRRECLGIPEDYFLSLESFESNHIKQAQNRHIYLEKFVETPYRIQSINALEEFVVQTDARVLLIHSQGGIGKTRLVLEALKRVMEHTKDIDVLFNQTKKNVNVDGIIPEISEGHPNLIVLDDAHRIENLTDFAKILLERNNAKFILITRSTARESVKREIGCPAAEIELKRFELEESIELLKDNLENRLLEPNVRHLGHICEGNALLIGITAHLVNTEAAKSLKDLKTNDLVENYLAEILSDIQSGDSLDYYQPFLAFLFLLKPFSVNDDETRSLIREFVDINKRQERSLLKDLKSCGVLERHGDTLWLYPDLLGEHLVETAIFSDTSILDFDEILSKIPSSHIERFFKTLRETVGEQTGKFLKRWVCNLSMDVESQNNDERSDSLRLLAIIAPRVPEETLQIIEILLKPESEKQPEKREDRWSPMPQDHCDILSQCLRILENSGLRYLKFDETLEQLLAMYFYKPEDQEYSVLREQALKAITNTAAYDLSLCPQGWEYSIQTKMFERVREWKKQSLEKYLPLILGVCRNLLQSEMRSEYADFEGVMWSRQPLAVTGDLIRLRNEVISMLQSIFNEVKASKQIEVIHVLNCATEFPQLGQYGEDMRTMIRDNAEVLIDFYLGLLTATTSPDVEVLQAIEEQIHRLRTWHQDDIKNLDNLLSALQSYESYQLHRTLVSDTALFWIDEGKSYDEIQTETAEKIKKIADKITRNNLIEWLEKLNGIAENFTNTYDQDISRFYQLLFEIGKRKPQIAQALIDQSLTKADALKKFAAEFIRGIRKSTSPDIAGNYVHEWLSGRDQMLLLQIPNTYWRVDEKSLDSGDVEIFETLQNCEMEDEKQRQELDRSIMSNIGWIYKTNPDKTIDIICKLFKRADHNSILHHMNKLWWSRGQIDLSQWDLSVFEDLLQTFVDIPVLNDNAVYILAQYGQKTPLELVPFFERRVAKQKQMKADSYPRYHAIPRLKAFAETYQDYPQYVDVLKQILGWFKKHDYNYDTAAAELISGIAPELGGSLKQTLMEFIKSGDKEKILAVMKVLEKFPEDSVSDELCKQAVKHAEGQNELRDQIGSIIVNRVRVSWGLDGAVKTFQNLKGRVIPWCEDENHYVRAFAQRIIPKIESRIEYEKERAAEDEIKRQKGLL